MPNNTPARADTVETVTTEMQQAYVEWEPPAAVPTGSQYGARWLGLLRAVFFGGWKAHQAHMESDGVVQADRNLCADIADLWSDGYEDEAFALVATHRRAAVGVSYEERVAYEERILAAEMEAIKFKRLAGYQVERPFAYCCSEGGGSIEGCSCVNPDHGTAWYDVTPQPDPRDAEIERLREALNWALNEIRATTRSENEQAFWNSYDQATSALHGTPKGYLPPVAFNRGTCGHRWAYAPTVGNLSCIDCGERREHDSPEAMAYRQALTSLEGQV